MSADHGMIGRIIAGKYRIDELLGEGSMGAVFGANQLALGKAVAVKVMRQELAQSAEFAERFQREAQAASRFTHSNSIQVTDFGAEADGLLYLVMERAQGTSLDAIVTHHGAMEEPRIARIMSQILSALAAAHDAGIVHRDLKPENILIVDGTDDDGNPIDIVKVCDFGIASIRGTETIASSETSAGNKNARLTAVGAIVGTPAYMAPEQAQGGSFDARSDVYSAGIVLYELLTGRIPFDGNSLLDVVAKHIHEAPVSPQKLNPNVSSAMASICLRAIAKSPSERYPNARAMRAEFRALQGVPLSEAGAPSVTFGARSTPLVMSDALRSTVSTRAVNPRLRAIPMVAAMLLATAGVGAAWLYKKQTPAPTVQVTTAEVPLHIPSSAPSETSLPLASAQVLPRSNEPTALPVTIPSANKPTVSLRVVPGSRRPEEPTALPVTPEPIATAAQSEPPVVVAERPLPTPTAAPVVQEAPKPFTPDRGRVRASVASASRINRGAVQAVLGRINFDSCYQTAIRTLGHNETGAGSAHLDIDEDGVLRVASISVPGSMLSAKACISSKIQGQHVTPPDTGNAAADVSFSFEMP